MTIFVTAGSGTGHTLLAAFDRALQDAGVFNYNLIHLSSVIPPHSTIVTRKYSTPADHYGNRLYIVKAEQRSQKTGNYIGAGLGWYQLDDGRGVFVEHELERATRVAAESALHTDIVDSLTDLCTHRGYTVDTSKMRMHIEIIRVKEQPACVLVLGVYHAEQWT